MAEAHRLDPKIRVVWTVGSLIPIAVLALTSIALAVGGIPEAAIPVGAGALAFGALALWLPTARWRSWLYRLTDTELIIAFGVLVKVERWLPRTRIQHVDIVGGPIERALGLRQLVIYTAGTREADVTVPGLPQATAESLRDDLLSWVKSTRPPADAGVPEPSTGSDPRDDEQAPAQDPDGDRWEAPIAGPDPLDPRLP